MQILITGADSPFGRAAAAHLESRHSLRLAPTDCDLRDPRIAADLVAGIDAVAHLALYPRIEPSTPAAERELLDRAARGTFVLQHAALEAGVARIVLGSRLDVLTDYPAAWRVDETWKPVPATDAASLAPYLAELTLREFARAEPLHATALRFGEVDPRSPRAATVGATSTSIPRAASRSMLPGRSRSRWKSSRPRSPLLLSPGPPHTRTGPIQRSRRAR
jgi:nucleoside-diphosphate-sugar epimerase